MCIALLFEVVQRLRTDALGAISWLTEVSKWEMTNGHNENGPNISPGRPETICDWDVSLLLGISKSSGMMLAGTCRFRCTEEDDEADWWTGVGVCWPDDVSVAERCGNVTARLAIRSALLKLLVSRFTTIRTPYFASSKCLRLINVFRRSGVPRPLW